LFDLRKRRRADAELRGIWGISAADINENLFLDVRHRDFPFQCFDVDCGAGDGAPVVGRNKRPLRKKVVTLRSKKTPRGGLKPPSSWWFRNITALPKVWICQWLAAKSNKNDVRAVTVAICVTVVEKFAPQP
jgi:hypothetical protein